jgi:octaprenyl-diphosphate synthase
MNSPGSADNRRSSRSDAPNLDEIYAGIRPEMDEVERNIRDWTRSSNPLIDDVSRTVFQNSGKRLRPALLLLASKIAGYSGTEDAYLAALVEIIHTASLIHDDIVDNAGTRRGKVSAHAQWGPNVSVLLGDYLFIKSIGLSLRLGNGRIIRILSDLSARMIEGELMEYSRAGDLGITEAQYMEIIDMKTASLFTAAARIGAILGNAPDGEETRLAAIGRSMGISFQIVDDLLDCAGDEQVLGKPVFSDLGEGRITLPLIHALNSDRHDDARALAERIRGRNPGAGDRSTILGILRRTGSLDYARGKAAECAARVGDLLAGFPESPHTEALRTLSEFILDRKN